MSSDLDQKTDYLYREYVRLSEQSDELIKSTFDDFKLFGVVGAAIVVWKPIADAVAPTNSKFDSSSILFLGFLSLLSIIGTVVCLNLIKQSYTWYFVHNLQAYEIALRRALGESETSQVFNFNLGKEEPRFITAVYKTSFKFFSVVLAFVIILVPSTVLAFSTIPYASIYLLFSSLSIVLYFQAFRRMLKQYSDRNYF